MTALVTIPTFQTDRLTLRAPMTSDFAAYAAFRMGARSVTVGGPFTEQQAFHQFCALFGHWQYHGFGRWMVADRESDAPLGIVGLYHPLGWPEPEIGWSVFDVAEGRGIAFEAARATRQYAYDTLRWRTVISAIAPGNTRSQALARRMGARQDGHFDDPSEGKIEIWRHLSPEECL